MTLKTNTVVQAGEEISLPDEGELSVTLLSEVEQMTEIREEPGQFYDLNRSGIVEHFPLVAVTPTRRPKRSLTLGFGTPSDGGSTRSGVLT